ncbi:Fms-interacting protein (macronuclear) [Tetrahymena thermophila SB210]|uniref:Fms-interacting protein n=1 Tax=Tetrahymena thermophila (strain SB210) TaxID=312017 RepID=I7MB63_TETTS|nr:Fms-interacting protein [Tetrahymena thermophila SB210]EAS07727.2 Fms-interacting protein [Tetrahymena thermophila SB210]|eukprot:XP_001027969.2 Fms-interacting protein [Tetrahymena thermophila SB210]
MEQPQNLQISETTNEALKYTQELRQQINDIRETLSKIVTSKKEGNSNILAQQIGDKNCITQLLKIRSMRQKHRRIQISIEEERNKIRTEKEKIEKTSVFLSGLEYLQSTIVNSIQRCQSIQMENLQQVNNKSILGQLKRKPVQDFVADDFIDLKNELESELQKRIKKNEEHIDISKQLVSQREQYDSVINQYTQLLSPILTNLSENLKSLKTVFSPITNQPLAFNPIQHSLASQLPPPLYSVYSKLSLLFDCSPSYQSSVEIIQQIQNQSNNKRQNELHHLELAVTIKEYLPTTVNFIDNFLSNYKITLQKQTVAEAYPIKFYIRFIENLNTLVIQLDSKHMKGKEIFSGLFQNDFGSPLILYTQDEYDKNLNQQYEFYNWLQILGGINNRGNSTVQVDAQNVLTKINERFVSKKVVKSIIDALTSGSFQIYPLFKSQKEKINENELQKYKFEHKQKLQNTNDLANSSQFKQLKPSWLKRKPEQQFDLIEEENNSKKLVDQVSQKLKNVESQDDKKNNFDQYVVSQKEVLQKLNLDNESNETEIHIFNITKGDQFNAQVMIIMPLSTLVQEPTIRIISASIKSNSLAKTALTSLFNKDLIIQQENKGDNQQQQNTQFYNIGSLIINQIESEMKSIQELMPEQKLNSQKVIQFALVYQLNRLITLFEVTINHYQQYSNLVSKCFMNTPYDILDI